MRATGNRQLDAEQQERKYELTEQDGNRMWYWRINVDAHSVAFMREPAGGSLLQLLNALRPSVKILPLVSRVARLTKSLPCDIHREKVYDFRRGVSLTHRQRIDLGKWLWENEARNAFELLQEMRRTVRWAEGSVRVLRGSERLTAVLMQRTQRYWRTYLIHSAEHDLTQTLQWLLEAMISD